MMKLRLPAFNLRSISILLTVLLSFVLQTQAAVVTTANDFGAGSLREAISNAPPGDTISFTNTLSGQTIVLTNGQLTVNKNLTIDASALAGGITIDGNANGRIFEFTTGTTNVLEDLTLTNGLANDIFGGGAIYLSANANLTINKCNLSGNSGEGGAILSIDGTLSLSNSTLSENFGGGFGGGIFSIDGTLSLSGSTVSGNDASLGGGIFTLGTLTHISNSTLSGNSAWGEGGGIYNDGGGTLSLSDSTVSSNIAGESGGGIFNAGTLSLSSSTVSGNSANNGGGIYNSGGIITLSNSTLAENSASGSGGGVYNNNGPLTLSNSTIAVNTAGEEGGGIYGISGSGYGILNSINSIIANNFILGSLPLVTSYPPPIDSGSNNILGAGAILAPLGDYGGPTQTMPPVRGSAAIDAGIDTGSLATTDQRGLPRVVGGGVDIGAVEATLQETSYFVTTTADSGAGSLRQTIIDVPAGATIAFTNTLSGQTIVLTNGQLTVNKNLTIDASALAGGITIDGNANGRIFAFSGGATNVLENLTLTNGLAGAGSLPANIGGAIFVDSAYLTLNNTTLSGNSAAYDGGGIFNNGEITLNNSTLSGNSDLYGGNGGGIYNNGGCTLRLNNSTLSGNSATYYGGGIYNLHTLTLNNSTLSGNSAVIGGGGGIYNQTTLNSTNSIVAGNTAPSDPNLNEPLTSGSNNLTSGDPMLAPLGDYGGPTQTMPPLPGSPAIDAGIDTGSLPATDQRGYGRVVGAVDIGAVELQSIIATDPPMLTVSTALGDGMFRFAFTNLSGAGFTVFASTNVALPFATWTNLGSPVENPSDSGQFEFADPGATIYPARFYRVTSP